MAVSNSFPSSESWVTNLHEAIGSGSSTDRLVRTIRRIARLSAPVLVIGEPGCGQADVVRAICAASKCGVGPISSFSCLAPPSESLENFLLRSTPHEWTGQPAIEDSSAEVDPVSERQQRSVLIDRVEHLSWSNQVFLYEWLCQRYSLRPTADSTWFAVKDVQHEADQDRPMDGSGCRLIVTAGLELDYHIRQQTYHPELYYLLNALRIELTPLRERKQDLPELIRGSMDRSTKRFLCEPPRIATEAMKTLTEYAWPGNIAELQSVMDRVIAMNESNQLGRNDVLAILEPKHALTAAAAAEDFETLAKTVVRLGIQKSDSGASDLHERIVGQVEKELIAQVLADCDHVQTKAAVRLGMNRNTLHKKIKDYGLDEDASKGNRDR